MKRLGRFLFAMMSMVLFFGMAPMTVEAESSSVYVGGTWLELDTYYKTDANGHVTTDGASATDYNVFVTKNDTGRILTLNNATINGMAGKNNGTGIDCAGSTPVEIKLQGNNTVSAATAEQYYSYGIESSEQLTISGTDADKLTVVADVYDSRTNKEFSSYGIYVWNNMIIQGGTIEVYAGKAESVNGIYVSGDFIVNGGNTTVTAGTATMYTSHGIYARGENMKVTGGTLSSTGGEASSSSSYGIRTDENMEITGGTITAIGKTGSSSDGLYVKGNLKVENATIVANSGNGSTSSSIGLFVFGDLTVTNSKITASAQDTTGYGSFGIDVQSGGGIIGNMVVTKSTIIATAKGAANQSAGIKVDAGLTMTVCNITATAGNADRTWGIYSGDELTIQDSVVSATAGEGKASLGISAGDYLTITQTEGKTTDITAQGGNALDGSSYGIGSTSGSIEISGGTIKAFAMSSNDNPTSYYPPYSGGYSYGIGAEYNITISGGNITASAYTSDTDSALLHSFGIGANNTITISGGSITANGGVATTGNSYGIGTYGDFEVSGTPVIVAKGGKSIENDSFGIGIAHDPSSEYPDSSGNINIIGGNLTVAGGEITAEGGKAGQKSYGISATDNGTIAGKLTATGGAGTEGSCGLYTGGTLLVEENGVVSGTAGDSKESVGVGVKGTNGIMVDGGSLTGVAGSATGTDKDSMGVAAAGTIYVENAGSLTGTGGNSSNGRSLGVGSDAGISVDSSTLTGNGGAAGTDSLGVGATGNITYKDSEINATGGTAGRNSYGTGADGNITFEGGKANVSGGASGTNGVSYGAGANGTLSLSNTDLTGTGNSGALGGAGGFTNNNTSTGGYKLFVSTSNTNSSEWNGQDAISQYKYARNTNTFYTVTFVAGEGSGTMNSLNVPEDGAITLPECGFNAPANKEFAGWKIDTTEYRVGDPYTVSANTTVTAQWKLVTHVVTYKVDGEEYATIDVEHGSDVPAEDIPEIPTKEGYTQTAPTWDNDGRNVTADRTINAKYTINKYTVTYMADGKEVDTVTVEYGASVATSDIPTIPAKAGYDQTTPAWDNDGSNVTSNRTINAKYTINKYTVTYMADGEEVDTVTVEHGASVAANDIPEIPTKTGYDQTAPIWDNEGKNITANKTINAVYTINVYTIAYDANGGTGAMNAAEATYGQEFTLPESTFTAPKEQKFKAWSVDGAEYAEGSKIVITKDTTVTAVWVDLDKYTVLYDANGGIGAMDSAEVTIDTVYTLANNGFTAPENQKFKAWQIGDDLYAEGGKITVTADVVVKALWEDITYVVSYDANGGTGTMTDAIATKGKEFTLPACGFTAAEGMQFKAWSINGTEYEAGVKVIFTANTTVTAVWEELPFDYQMTSIVPPVFKGTGTIVATSNGEFNKFQKVEVDGKEISKDVDYTAVSGSTVVTLQEAYLKTLAVGQHEIKIVFTDGEVSGYFAVEAAATPAPATPAPTQKPVITPAPTQAPTATPAPTYVSPKTGVDYTGMILAVMIIVMAAGGMVVCTRKKN